MSERSLPSAAADGRRVAVVGAGIAGLAAAHDLRRAGLTPVVFEERDRVGGRVWTVRRGDFLMDLGTAVYLGTYRDAIALIDEVGLTDEFVERAAMGAIPRGGKMHYLDYSRPVRTALSTGVLSPRGKLIALKLARTLVQTRKSLGYDSYELLADIDTETVREYCTRTLDDELLQYMGRPLVSGTWVADDADTSVALMLWTIRNMLVPNVYNLRTGVAALPEALAAPVDTRLSHTVRHVEDTGTEVQVTYAGPDGTERTEAFAGAIVATTAQPALGLYPQMDANHRTLYETARYRRLGSVCLGLAKRPPDPATYFLVPPREDPDTIAVVADHNKSPGRAPDDKGLLTVLLSHEYLEWSEDLDDDAVLQRAVQSAERYHGRLADQIEETAVVRWDESVPTIDKGRFKLIAAFTRQVDRTARVQLASDLDRIPGLNGALVSGRQAAGRLVTAVGP
jgi:oxygen-dependent protoporphyrinogen oxidase